MAAMAAGVAPFVTFLNDFRSFRKMSERLRLFLENLAIHFAEPVHSAIVVRIIIHQHGGYSCYSCCIRAMCGAFIVYAFIFMHVVQSVIL